MLMRYYVQELTENRQIVSSQEFENIDDAVNKFAESTAYICILEKNNSCANGIEIWREKDVYYLYYINATKSSTHIYSDLDISIKRFRYYVKRYL